MLTISEIAALAGVSKTTISNVLNGKLEQVGPLTRQRIEALIKEHGYVPTQAARSLKSKRTKTLGLLFPHLPAAFVSNTFFFPGFLTGVARACEEYSYQLFITTSAKSCDTEFHYESLLKSRSVDGLIVSEIFSDDQRFPILEQFGIPFVSIGKPEGNDVADISWVDHNQEKISYHAVLRLLEHGHRDILFLGLSSFRVFTKQRLRGYKKALMEAQVPFRKNLVLCEEISAGEVKENFVMLMQKGIEFSAIFAISEPLALGSLKALQDLDLGVPRDISVLANIETDNHLFYIPPLTGVKIQTEKLGYETAKLLIQNIEGEIKEPIGKYVDADFIQGSSCAPKSTSKQEGVV